MPKTSDQLARELENAPASGIDELSPRFLKGDTKFSQGPQNYNVTMRRFPLDTRNAADLKHSVIFYINVRGKSKALSRAGVNDYTRINDFEGGRVNKEQVGNNLVKGAQGIAIAANIALANSLAQKAIANIGVPLSTKVKVLGQTAAIATGAATGAFTAEQVSKLFEPDKRFRINTAIELAINERPSVKYGVQYGSVDLGTIGGVLGGGASGADFNTMLPEITRKALMNLAQVPASLATQFAGEGSTDLGNVIGATTAMAPNPFREQIFQSVDTRTFTFDYKFLPKDAKETEAARNIIKEFKYHMHPELSANGLFYIYPSEFNIVYYYANKENLYFNRISTCVLTDLQVDYGNSQNFGTFSSGAPTEINLKLTFRELEVLTKERIDKEY
jgi:hypothetical protein